MNNRFRSSKFRHVYGAQTRRENTYENIRITRNTHDSNFCSVNPQYVAVVLESSGGGSFAVLDVNRPGRVDINCPKVCGHSGAILDVKWNPFNDNVIASASDDCTVKLWTIPEPGITGVLTDWTADLHGHSRKVAYIEWHTTAANILMSVAFDFKVMIWNVEQAEPVTSLACHHDTIYSVTWGRDGSVIASTNKDKKIRVMDPRSGQVVVEADGHDSTKPSKVVFVGDNCLFTSGFSRVSNRQYGLWDVRKPGTPLCLNDLDCSSGTLLPYMDVDNNVVYLAGKGDGLIRYFEIVPDAASVHFLNCYQSPLPQRGLAMMPKRGVDTSKNELTRFFKLHASKNLVEPISMIVPRKAEGFQHDIYPPTCSIIPSCTADEWASGLNRGPILLNLEDGGIMDRPKSSMSPAVQPQMAVLSKAPQITTYKALSKNTATVQNRTPAQNRTPYTTVPQSTHRTSHGAQSSQRVSHSPDNATDGSGLTNGNEKLGSRLPASIKNIRRLSMTREDSDNATSSTNQQMPSSVAPAPENSSERQMSVSMTTSLFNGLDQNQNQTEHEESPDLLADTLPDTSSNPKWYEPNSSCRSNTMDTSSNEHISAIKLVLGQQSAPCQANHEQKNTPDSPPETRTAQRSKRFGRSGPLRSKTVDPTSNEHVSALKFVLGQHAAAAAAPSQPSLKKAYFRQLEEIRSLQEQIQLKDKRIKLLETELSQMKERESDLQPGESNC